MKPRGFHARILAGIVLVPVVVTAFGPPEKPTGSADNATEPGKKAAAPGEKAPNPTDAMAEMMAKAKHFTAPGEHHEWLKKFLGKWDLQVRMYMGGKMRLADKGTSEFKWMFEGRWMEWEWTGTFMKMPFRSVTLMGYDNFKQSYVTTTISNIDTMMVRSEGDVDPNGNVLITYGQMDEYLTGENDKMVRYIWRFESDDKMTFEVYDLPIGETNNKVFDVVMTRVK